MIADCEVDLSQLQLEQHYSYQRRERKKAIADAARTGKLNRGKPENLIGYTWDKVSHWKHDAGSKYCTLYDKAGHVLDRLNLDKIIQNYVEKLSGYVDVDPREIEKEAGVYEKEYKLLKLLLERDMDAETAMHMLKINRDELNRIISKLSQMEMLQYTDFNTVELTNIGIGYISKKDKEIK
jgi:MoaA/NifB/PqqE/SkfB family radical SAM enzyme